MAKTKDVLAELVLDIQEDRFTDAGEKLQKVVNGKIRNTVEKVKAELYPDKKSA